MSFLGDNLLLFFFNENFAFWLKNDIYCSWFMVFYINFVIHVICIGHDINYM